MVGGIPKTTFQSGA